MTGGTVRRALPGGPDRDGADDRMRELLALPDPGPVARHLALLHFTGRRSGRPYTVPAGVHRLDGGLVVATGSGWRHNFAGGAAGELTWQGLRGPVLFRLDGDAERTARGYLELYHRYGDAAGRRLGVVATAVPDLAAFRAAVAADGLALVDVVPEAGTWGPAAGERP